MSAITTNEDVISVEVRPFKHQVGGHTCVLQVGKSTICKPHVEKEVWFYEHAPEELQDFIPKYLGKTYVTCDLSQKRKYLVAMVPRDIAARDGLVEQGKRSHEDEVAITIKRRKKNKENMKKESRESWSDICVERQINRYGFWANNQPQKFIMLENLVHDYHRPCMMDLKMGRRQYGEDSDDAKRRLLESRCAKTTSVTLGFRICGSKSYQSATDSFTFHDKYFGRHLSDTQAIEEIESFFHNGAFLRRDAIKELVAKLDNLYDVLISQSKLYFHSASLLLLYDGASCTCYESDQFSTNELSNHGNQSSMDQENHPFTNCRSNKNEPKIDDQIDTKMDNIQEFMCATANTCAKDVASKPFSCGDMCSNVTKVDVRLIDFAHVSENLTNVNDCSIIFGLKNLRDILQKLLDD